MSLMLQEEVSTYAMESRCEVVELVSRALQLQAFSRFSWSEVRGASTNRLLSEKGEVK